MIFFHNCIPSYRNSFHDVQKTLFLYFVGAVGPYNTKSKEPVLELAIVIRADVNLKNFFRYHFLLHENNNNNTNNNREYVCNLFSCERVKRGSTKASIPDNAKLQTSIPTPCWKIPLYTKGAEADNAGN